MDNNGRQVVEQSLPLPLFTCGRGPAAARESVGTHVQSVEGEDHHGVQLGPREGSEVETLQMNAQHLFALQ